MTMLENFWQALSLAEPAIDTYGIENIDGTMQTNNWQSRSNQTYHINWLLFKQKIFWLNLEMELSQLEIINGYSVCNNAWQWLFSLQKTKENIALPRQGF